MKHRLSTMVVLLVVAVAAPGAAQGPAPAATSAPALAPVALPAPQTDGGKPLMQALKLRASSRAFAPDPIPPQTLSNLLWAAWGINRPEEGKRTAPSARNWQEIDVVVVDATGAFLYDAKGNSLQPIVAGDLRALTGMQDFVKEAPVTLVLVADTSRMEGAQNPEPTANADAAFICQNVYLFCASEGLAVVVRGSVDRPPLAKALKLGEKQIIVLAQTIGFPKK
ncbi:MAG TPA: SagB/ThcOx family dehydrogenase [Vicinamibacteria bacterium]|nr:SagB/ThcOx family dehydrogenase [Vicinamibacteria bacterium]